MCDRIDLAKKTITERGNKVKQKVLVIFEYEEAYKKLQSALESVTIAPVFAATPDDAIQLGEMCRTGKNAYSVV